MSIVLASFQEKRRNFYPSIQAQTKKAQGNKTFVNETGSKHFGVEKM
ncbi:hypothetical protein [Nostoc sp. DSM 114167]|jgi:hypothetical protein